MKEKLSQKKMQQKRKRELLKLKKSLKISKNNIKVLIEYKRIQIGLSADDKVLGLFIGHTESRNRYNIIHPDPRNIGIVGATPSQWGRFLKIRKIPINSLRAGVVIFNYYLIENNNLIRKNNKYIMKSNKE